MDSVSFSGDISNCIIHGSSGLFGVFRDNSVVVCEHFSPVFYSPVVCHNMKVQEWQGVWGKITLSQSSWYREFCCLKSSRLLLHVSAPSFLLAEVVVFVILCLVILTYPQLLCLSIIMKTLRCLVTILEEKGGKLLGGEKLQEVRQLLFFGIK